MQKTTRKQILLYLHISGNKALAPILASYRSLSIVIQIYYFFILVVLHRAEDERSYCMIIFFFLWWGMVHFGTID